MLLEIDLVEALSSLKPHSINGDAGVLHSCFPQQTKEHTMSSKNKGSMAILRS